MEIEFDKEIDAILRRARTGRTVSATENSKFQIPDAGLNQDSASEHLDADEISAFAENALPEKTKSRYTAHFAYCDSCRKKLSNLISLNGEAEIEIVPVKETATILSTPPWYRRIFAFPNLAYTMGGLLILFGGIIGFIAVQNFNNSQVSEISQINEKAQINREAASENSIPSSEPNSTIVLDTNSTSAFSSNTMANSPAGSSMMNSNMSVAAKPNVSAVAAPKSELNNEGDLSAANKNSRVFSPDGQEQTRRNDDSLVAAAPAERRAEKQPPSSADKKLEMESKAKSDSSSIENQIAELPSNGRQSSELQKGRVLNAPMAKSKPSESTSAESATVRGKNFNRRNNVWYDAGYNDQPLTRVTRGTKQYKNLDKDLRGIAENLGGTVIIVWNGKAYRIQ